VRGWSSRGRSSTPRARSIGVQVSRGGIRFLLDGEAGTVTCTVCRLYGSSSGPELPLFMAQHVGLHTGSSAAPAAADRGAQLAVLVEQVAQLGDDELAVVGEIVGRLVGGRSQYGELKLDEDRRDFDLEASDELRDYLIYRAIETIRRRRRGGA
jgi:hypothetical protein